MKALIPIAEKLILDQVLSSKPPVSARMKATGLFLGLCLFFFFAGLIALSYGLFLYLALHMPQFEAAFITGGALLFLALLTALSFYVYQAFKRKKKEAKRQETEELVGVIIETIRSDLAQTTRENPETTLLLTALSGFIAGKTLS